MDFLVLPGGLVIATIGFVVGTIVILRCHRTHVSSMRRAWPAMLHVAGMIALGVIVAAPAASYGIRLYCVEGAGAQCGLAGVLGTGPMAFGVAALAYATTYAIWDVE